MIRTAAPYAPAYLVGLGDSSDPSAAYPDQDYWLPYDVVLTAGQVLSDSKPIERDANFIWRGLVIAPNSSTGLYAVQFAVNGRDFLSPSLILSTNLLSDPSSPFPVWPEFEVPAGGRISINLQDLSAAQNTIQILFRGTKRTPRG